MKSQNFRKSGKLFGALCGGLLSSLPAIPQALAQESTVKVNPSPSIFSEPPYNRSQAPGSPESGVTPPRPIPPAEGQVSPVPPRPIPPAEGQVSPVPPRPIPGDRTQQPSPPAVSNDQQPLVEPRQTPSATIALTNGMVNIRLVNNTAAKITFQVIGDTAPRSLEGKSDVTLQALKAPVTVTFERQDSGQLIVTPQASLEPGSLEVTFKEATNATQGRSAMRIERNGSVFLN
ncbi:hypothetical protein [Nostoc sp. DedSLP04]|uniref:hypothetical protein n=1 Tax=Nostoc sp. DedSLP04 TaxID=3075401 RepID=UPI002AD464F2|nr:hypothetical protein [Nostoc sp. DedSLP04]MDZ8035031.1 hypothetical protein [Nostoc sp. DedSLP04]